MSHFDIPKLKEELTELEQQTVAENFWNDSKNSAKVLTKIKQLKSKCTEYENITNEITNLQELTELVELEPDEEISKDILKNQTYNLFFADGKAIVKGE